MKVIIQAIALFARTTQIKGISKHIHGYCCLIFIKSYNVIEQQMNCYK